MKKILLLAVAYFMANANANAQFWIEAGLKGLVGTTVPYNKNSFSDSLSNPNLKADFAYGAKIAFNFGDNSGIIVDGLMSQTKIDYKYGTKEENHNLAWRAINIYPMYRHYYERSFIEIGPKIGILSSMTETNKIHLNGTDAKDNFTATNYGAALGFGGYLFGSEFFSVSLNFRIDYQFTDFVSAKGKTAGYPLPAPLRTYTDYKPTNPISARGGIEIAIPLGGVAKAQCGKRVFFMGGNR